MSKKKDMDNEPHYCKICGESFVKPKELFITNNFEIIEILEHLRKNTPHPSDVFISKVGGGARHAYACALRDVYEELKKDKESVLIEEEK